MNVFDWFVYMQTTSYIMDTNEIPPNICLDLQKAFDTIDHTLLSKLKYYGWKGSTYSFHNYLIQFIA